jgi:hypothetical protein
MPASGGDPLVCVPVRACCMVDGGTGYSGIPVRTCNEGSCTAATTGAQGQCRSGFPKHKTNNKGCTDKGHHCTAACPAGYAARGTTTFKCWCPKGQCSREGRRWATLPPSDSGGCEAAGGRLKKQKARSQFDLIEIHAACGWTATELATGLAPPR